MNKRKLGLTGLEVCPIGFGAAPIGGHYGDRDDAGQIATVRYAIDRGINVIDTSPYYSETRSESLLGQALGQGYRDKVILATKVCRYGVNDFNFSARSMLENLEISLGRLKTDHVDIWHAHDIEFAANFDQIFTETAEALHKAKASGKCRFIGMTGYPPTLLAQAVEKCKLDVVLNYCHFSLTNDQMLMKLVPVAERHGVGLFNASPLMMGLFSSKGPPPWHPAPEALKKASADVVRLCVSKGVAPETLALQYVLADARIASTFVGMSSQKEVDVNLKALDSQPDAALLAEIRKIVAPVFNTEWPSGNWQMGR